MHFGGNMKTALSIIIFISSLFVVVSVVLQEGKDEGLSSAITGNTNLFGKGRERTLDATLQRITVIAGSVLGIAVFAMGVLFK